MNDNRTPSEQVTDGYNKVAFCVPYDRELEAMNDKQLTVEIEQSKDGSARRLVLQREMDKRDRALGTFVIPLPPDESFRRLKAVFRWLKEHVLAAIIIFVITTILGIYITKWLGSPQDQNRPPISEPRAMPV